MTYTPPTVGVEDWDEPLNQALEDIHDTAVAAQTTADGKANASHTHGTGDVTSGTLGVARGGTGLGTVPTNSFLTGNGTGGMFTRTPAQVYSDIDANNASNLNTGTVPIARVPTGTSGTTVALGNHNHDAAYAATSHNHAGHTLTPAGVTLASGDDLVIGALLSYTPVLTNIGTGTYGTARGRYVYLNARTVFVQADLTMTADGTGAGFPTFSLPVVPDRTVPCVFSLFLGDSGDYTRLIQGSTQAGETGAQIDKMVILRIPTGASVAAILEPVDWSSKGLQGLDMRSGLVLRMTGTYFV